MSLKRRDIIAWLLLLAAALALSFGNDLIQHSYERAQGEQTLPTNNAEWQDLAEPTAAEDNYDSPPPTMSTRSASAVTSPSQESAALGLEESAATVLDEFRSASERYHNYGILLWVFSAILAVTGIFVLWQRRALLGPDGACVLSAGVSLALFPNGIETESFLLILLWGFVSFAALRELWGWLRARCRLDWCACERMTHRVSRPRSVPARYLLWLAIPLLLIPPAALLDEKPLLLVLRLVLLLCALALGVACMVRFYRNAMRHFQLQLDRFRADDDVEVREGPYEKTEEKLREIQTSQREAVARAVADERFRVDLIANVSHDLRTPLTAILGYGELLEKQPMTEEGAAQLTRLNRKAEYMRDLVDSLFELTKVSSGVLEPKQEPIDLVRLLEQTIGLFDDQLTAAGLTVKRQYSVDEAPLRSDGALLHQVFANLLSNAIKYALHGTRIYLELSEAEGRYLVRMVNTASYEMDFTAEEIVQRFVRGDKARSTQGSGLGLAIAQTYAEALGGRFEIVIDGDQFNANVTLPKN